MADGLSTAVADSALSTIIASAADVALAIGAPGSAGTANPSSVTTRQAVTWGTPASGAVSASNQPAWTSWAGTNGEIVSHLTFWSALTGGTFELSMQLAASVTMDTGDSLTLTSLQISLPTAS